MKTYDLLVLLKASFLYDFFGKRSFSQSGEDVVVDAILSRKERGYYVDIGAYHPKIFSNTYLFYKRGWSGVCIEPNPEAKKLFSWARPRDRFVNMGVGTIKKKLDYFIFDQGATNTFDKETAKKNMGASRKLLSTKKIWVKPLAEILSKTVPEGLVIDLMSVDVEGMDMEVLKSNDWKKFAPRVVIVEAEEARIFLEEKGYKLVGMTGYSYVYRVIE